MDPATLIPPATPIPGAPGLFEVLLHGTLTVHLLFMNVVLGGALLALYGRAAGPDPDAALAPRLPTTLALTINLGVPPLLFLSVLQGQFLYTANILSAVWWLGLTGLVFAAYALLYVHVGNRKKGLVRDTALTAAAVLLLAVSFIMSNIMTLMQNPPAWTAYFAAPGGWLLNLADPTLAPRWLHFVVASLAVAGIFLALVSRPGANRGEPAVLARQALGRRAFVTATLAQLAVGAWFLAVLPPDIQALFLGGSTSYTGHLAAGVALALFAAHLAARGRDAAAAATVALAVLFMVLVRFFVKTAYLAPYYSLDSLTATPQPGALALFLLSLAGALALIAYMLRLRARAGGRV